jgi:hypothetical protein
MWSISLETTPHIDTIGLEFYTSLLVFEFAMPIFRSRLVGAQIYGVLPELVLAGD